MARLERLRKKGEVNCEKHERERERIKNKNKIKPIFFLPLPFQIWTQYCSSMLKILAFKTLDVTHFLVLGVLNAKYLAFGIPDANALIALYY